MITVEDVTRTYSNFTAVDSVSFTAERGRVTGFLGPNGAGKSTIMRIIVGLTATTHGTAHVLGRRFADPVVGEYGEKRRRAVGARPQKRFPHAGTVEDSCQPLPFPLHPR